MTDDPRLDAARQTAEGVYMRQAGSCLEGAMEKAVRAALDAADRAAWRPIETYNPKRHPGIALLWADRPDEDGLVRVAGYWLEGLGWLETSALPGQLVYVTAHKWMPLPSPPQD